MVCIWFVEDTTRWFNINKVLVVHLRKFHVSVVLISAFSSCHLRVSLLSHCKWMSCVSWNIVFWNLLLDQSFIRNHTNGFTWVLCTFLWRQSLKRHIITKKFVKPGSVVWSTLADVSRNIYATIWENYHEPRLSIIRYLVFRNVLNQFQSLEIHKYLWNIATAVKCHLLPATYFIRSVNVTGTYRKVTQQTKDDILLAVEGWTVF